MSRFKIIFSFLLLLVTASHYAQLGFCPGSKGDPIFFENFGNGTTYGPALPAGATTYPFQAIPVDGAYSVYYHSQLYSTWHYSLDHTPDATNGANGKMLLMNANASTAGDFYKRTVTGLCVNTTFEFSAWVMNVYNPNTNYCNGAMPQIPINVRFEIWNQSETILLGSGNTGNIMGSSTPSWQQFAIVFTTVSETTVVLKMKNNGVGGCGNDLAIDDISFAACGDVTTVSSPSVAGNTYTTCTNPTSLQLNAATASATPYFYQWQTSNDGTAWTNIIGETSSAYTTPNLNALAYFRVEAAQDPANLSNPFCSTTSNVFTISVLAAPTPAISTGDRVICSDDAIPSLSVNLQPLTSVNWYDAPTGGNLLLANSASYTPTGAGIYYAETYNTSTNCIATPRTAVELTIVPLPNATISGSASICSGSNTAVNFSGTPHAVLTYNVDGGIDQNIALNAVGLASIPITGLTATTSYTLVSAVLNTCDRLINETITIAVTNSLTASMSLSDTIVCHGGSATLDFIGTPNATVNYWSNTSAQSVVLDGLGSASFPIAGATATTIFSLIDIALGTCTQALSQSATLSVASFPMATISASPSTICANQTSTITFSGTPNAAITYTVDGGAPQITTLNGSGTAAITVTGLVSNSTYNLVSAASPDLNTCITTINDAVTLAVNSLPTASISTSTPVVCNGDSATVIFSGTPGATVNYSVNGGSATAILLNGAGNALVSISSVTATTTFALINVTAAAPNGCMRTLSQSVTISAVSLPTASLTANPSSICSGQTSTLEFSGTPGATLNYTANGVSESVTLNASGVALATTGALTVPMTYQLTHVSLGGCSQTISGSAVVAIDALPNVSYSGSLEYCDGEPTAITLSSDVAGTTFGWTVTQVGTAGAVSGTGNQIIQTLTPQTDSPGTVTYTVTPSHNGCAGNPLAINVTIHPLPIPQIKDGVICTTGSGQTSYILDTALDASHHTFEWFLGGDRIPGASAGTYAATQIGTYTVIATNAAGCASVPVDAVVGEMPQGESLMIEQSEAFTDDPIVAVLVTGGGGPFSFQLDQGAFQSSNVFYDVPAGTHTITVIDDYCTNLTATITVIDYPRYFTPNGDGFNDRWNIKGFDNAVIRIFDRYGKLLKQISPDGLGWDGTYNGRWLPSTDYWFTIEYTNGGMSKIFKSHFALKR